VCGEAVDLGRIKIPCYVLATREDHIEPWNSAYLATQWLGGPSQFVLVASGHIVGVINPATENKRSYWTGGKQGGNAQAWRSTAPRNTPAVGGCTGCSGWHIWAAKRQRHRVNRAIANTR